MTVMTKKPQSAVDHLTPEDIEELGRELDAIRQSVMASRGEKDAAYIRRVIKTQRYLELGSRAVLLGSAFPPAFVLGTIGLSIAKILDNMEIGHNIMHGQWDWMRDPKIHSSVWEWDNASTAEGWKHSHNELHHTYTNIVGKDNDLGWGIMRVDEDQRWTPAMLFQPAFNFTNMLVFEYGIAAYDLELGRNLRLPKEKRPAEFNRAVKGTLKKIRKQATKDYLVHPLIALPFGAAIPTLIANVTANVVRNVWSHSVIMCGHFPEASRRTRSRRSTPTRPAASGTCDRCSLRQHHRLQGAAHDDRQPVAPDRAPHLAGPAVQPLRGGRPAGAGPLREVRPAVSHRLDAGPGLQRLAQGRAAVVPEQLARHHQAEQPAQAGQGAVEDEPRLPRQRRKLQEQLDLEAAYQA